MHLLNPITQRRLESATLLAAIGAVYGHLEFSWAVFAWCFLLPDLSIPIYLKGPKFGGVAYNAAHCFLWPLLIGTRSTARSGGGSNSRRASSIPTWG
jgi:hypothetical protein